MDNSTTYQRFPSRFSSEMLSHRALPNGKLDSPKGTQTHLNDWEVATTHLLVGISADQKYFCLARVQLEEKNISFLIIAPRIPQPTFMLAGEFWVIECQMSLFQLCCSFSLLSHIHHALVWCPFMKAACTVYCHHHPLLHTLMEVFSCCHPHGSQAPVE